MPAFCHSTPNIHCASCHLGTLCLPISLQVQDVHKLESIVQRGRPLQKGQRIFHAGDRFTSVYAIRSGAVKTFHTARDGVEQITGFYLPGEVIGLDGIADDTHSNTAVTLETSAVCEIPFHRLEELSLEIPTLQRRFLQLMSKAIGNDQTLITLLSQKSADQRIGALLLSLSARHRKRGLSATEFNLPMSRAEMGNFLGLTIETVSRALGRLSKRGLIEVEKKSIRILNLDELGDSFDETGV